VNSGNGPATPIREQDRHAIGRSDAERSGRIVTHRNIRFGPVREIGRPQSTTVRDVYTGAMHLT
jgi:hypothetical protein